MTPPGDARSLSGLAVRALFLIAVFGASEASAQDAPPALSEYSHAFWRVEEGLAQDTVQAIAQTPDGYLWIATLEGLARFDGSRFRHFDRSNTAAFEGNDVSVLAVGRDGALWAGLYTGGIVEHRDGSFRYHGMAEGLPEAPVEALAWAPDGMLWIATSGAGLVGFKDSAVVARFTSREGLSHDRVRCLQVDAHGGLWAGTMAGLDHLSGGQLRHYSVGLGVPATALAADKRGRLWIGTPAGLFRLEGEAPRLDSANRLLPQRSILRLFVDSQDSLWVATEAGLNRVREGRAERYDGLTDDSVESLFEDSDAGLWIGTTQGGLNRLRRGPAVSYAPKAALPSRGVDVVAPARDGGFYLAGAGEVALFRDGSARSLNLRETLDGSPVLALLEDSRGRLWVGNTQGVHRRDRGHWTHYGPAAGAPSGAVRAFLEDRAGRIWFGTDGGGVGRFEGERIHVLTTRDGLASDQVRALLEDHEGTLWIGTYGGLSALREGRFTSYTKRDGLSHDMVRSLHEDADGGLWIGTYGGGLNRWRFGRFGSVTSRDGLFNDVIYTIFEDGAARLWMSSNKGLFSVAREQLDAFFAGKAAHVASVVYGRADGLLSAEGNGGSPAGVLGTDGRAYFATTGGLAAVDPNSESVLELAPAALVEGVALNGEEAPSADPLPVGPGNARIELRFTAVDFVSAHRLRFGYRLRGFDGDWIDPAGGRTAQYTNVPPGEYRFEVRVARGDGPWNETGTGLRIRVEPYWYRRRGFVLLASALALVAAVSGYRMRVRSQQAREQELARRVEQALSQVRTLSGLLPICANCKKIRDDQGYWQQLEGYLREHTEASFTHGICPDCLLRHYPETAERLKARTSDENKTG